MVVVPFIATFNILTSYLKLRIPTFNSITDLLYSGSWYSDDRCGD